MKSTALIFVPFCLMLSLAGSANAQWPANPRADLVLGNRETQENSLVSATAVAIDKVNRKIYVSCGVTHRVLRFDQEAAANSSDPLVRAEAVLGQPDFNGNTSGVGAARMNTPGAMAVDSQGRLWVADRANRRVLRFDSAFSKSSGASADGVLSQPDFNSKGFNQLTSALNGVAVDAAGNVFVSDATNSAVYRYNNAAVKAAGAPPDAVLGQPNLASKGPGLSATAMNQPWGISVDSTLSGTSLFVVDRNNNRVRFDNANTAPSGAAASSVLGQPDMVTNAAGTAMSRFDSPEQILSFNGSLYVSDPGNYRTLRFPGSAPAVNASAVGTLRADPNLLGGVSSMSGDAYGRLWGTGAAYVARFDTPGGTGVINRVSTFGNANVKLDGVKDIAIDPASGKVFVSSQAITRGDVFRYSSYAALTSGAQPEASVCAIQSAATAGVGKGVYLPYGLCVDNAGRLWVADATTSAVYRFDNAATMPAYTQHTAKLGGASGNAANQMTMPQDVYADNQGRVWVADTNNHRILRFDNAAAKADGAPANAVLGQTGFGVSTVPASPTWANLQIPRGVTGDAAGNIFVADTGHHRVLRYSNAAAKANGGTANGVLGQTIGTTAVGALGGAGLDGPTGLALDNTGNLWVSEAGNRRVVRFPSAASLPNGFSSDVLVGQPDYWHNNVVTDNYHVTTPAGIAVDPAGRLFVADTEADRVLRFSPVSLKILSSGLNLNKAFSLTYSSTFGALYDIESSPDLQTWSWESTQVGGGNDMTWTTKQAAVGRRFYRVVMQ
jgi:sugar lactone lactonase YvrE